MHVLAGIAAGLAALFLWLSWALPLGRSLAPLGAPTLVLVTADGKPFARRGAYKEAPVDVRRLPAHVSNAFIAAEDRRFGQHIGIDLRAIARAAMINVRSGSVRQGGSTITQQLAKNAFLSPKRNLRRKAQEAVIAIYLEMRLSKADILSRYLSSVYFGDGVFGLGAASRHYFDKPPERLSPGEAAMLAGLVKAPTRLAPTVDFKAAHARAGVVLAAMQDAGMISQADATRALAEVRLRPGRARLPVGSYFADWISPQVKLAFNRAYGEVVVQTTLDSGLQQQAQRALRRGLERGAALGVGQGALVALRADGRVVAMVGGRDYRQSQFNRAVQAKRQPGSAFKLFVYLASLRAGLSPDSLVLDQPVTIGGWSPENHEGRYAGRPVALRDAFARSSNVASARLVQQVGPPAVIAAARDLGITSPLPEDATLALGTGSVSLLELTAAYASVAAGETPVTPRGVAAVERTAGHPLPARDREALLLLLRDVMERGTGAAANLGPGVYGKTGTSQDYRDAWFVGFAGDLIVGVWLGNDDNRPMRGVTGGSIPAQVWREFMTYAMARRDFQGVTVLPEDAPLLDLEALADDTAPLDDDGVLALPDEPPPSEAPQEPPGMTLPERPELRPEDLEPPAIEPAPRVEPLDEEEEPSA